MPNTTAVPDNFFDVLMPTLSEAQLKVVLYIMRRTFGFKKNSDNISVGQMVNGITKRTGEVLDLGTGLSRRAVIKAVKELVEQGVIVKNRNFSHERGDEAATFSLRFYYNPTPPRDVKGGANYAPPRVQIMHPQDIPTEYTEITVNRLENPKKTKNLGGTAPYAPKEPRQSKNPIKQLPDLNIDKDEIAAIAGDIVTTLGDRHSGRFYYLVAAKIPKAVIFEHLADIRDYGAEDPPRLFTHRMNTWATERLEAMQAKEKLDAITRDVLEQRQANPPTGMQSLSDILSSRSPDRESTDHQS